MFEGINKYTLELAIDQEKIKHGLNPDIPGSHNSEFKYGSNTFMDRESAKDWIKNQKISPDKLMKEIGYERNLSAKKGEISPLEDLFKIYEDYYNENLLIRQETWKASANIRKNAMGKLIEKTPTIKVPILDPMNLQELLNTDIFTIGSEELEIYYNETERILPLGDPTIEKHGYTFAEMGEFIRQSIQKLGGTEISAEDGEKIASRIVRIENSSFLRGSYGTGFIHNGKIYTNDHVVRGGDIRIFDLMGTEIKNLTYSIPKKFTWHEDKDVTIVDSPDLEKYKENLQLNLPGGYIFGTKPIHRSISPGQEGGSTTGLWIQKADIKNVGELNSNDPKGTFRYTNQTNNISGTSGSIVFNDGKAIGVNSFSSLQSFANRKLWGIIPVGSLLSELEGPIHGTKKNIGKIIDKNGKESPYPGGGWYIDVPNL